MDIVVYSRTLLCHQKKEELGGQLLEEESLSESIEGPLYQRLGRLLRL